MARRIDTRYWVFSINVLPSMLEIMGSKTRLLLVCAFGGLLLLTIATGVAALTIFERIRAGEAALRARFVERSDWLEKIRGAIYLSGTVARDYFVEPDGPEAAALREKLSQLKQDTSAGLARYESSSPGDRHALSLRGEVVAYWQVLDLMVEMARKRRTTALDAYFRKQLAQRRETMLEIATGIGATLGRQWDQGQAELAHMYVRLRWTLGSVLALVVVLGAVLAVAAVRKVVRLESEARSLSAQLVRTQEEERRAIARELHDEIGQALSGLLLDVGAASAMTEAGAIRSRLGSIAVLAERLVEQVRRVALSLRPSMLDDLGLVPALEWQAREVGQRTGLDVRILAEESAGDLPDAHRTCIYRVVQEALRNSARHAGANAVRIGLQKAAGSVLVRVEDDGKGFTVGRTRGLGLLGMEERVAELGGRFRVHSEAGRGTTVKAELPI